MLARTLLHRLLYVALIETRMAAHEGRNQEAFAVAHFFHTLPLQLERAARGEVSYDDLLTELRANAERSDKGGWFTRLLSNATPQTPEQD